MEPHHSNTLAATTVRAQPLLALSTLARSIHARIVERLEYLSGLHCGSCLEPQFRSCYNEVLGLFELFQNEILSSCGKVKTCGKGCSCCCYHWVEDVNSFEAEMIADYVRTTMPLSIERIVRSCRSDLHLLQRLDRLTGDTLSGFGPQTGDIDQIDLLLSAFYQMKRPCPLLGADGVCRIYDIRPFTCRIYMSFTERSRCSPDYINDGDIPTYLLDLEEEANALLDRLHFKYMRFEGDTGLRSLLIKYLGN